MTSLGVFTLLRKMSNYQQAVGRSGGCGLGCLTNDHPNLLCFCLLHLQPLLLSLLSEHWGLDDMLTHDFRQYP